MNYRSMPPTRRANYVARHESICGGGRMESGGNNNIVPVLGVDADAGGRTNGRR